MLFILFSVSFFFFLVNWHTFMYPLCYELGIIFSLIIFTTVTSTQVITKIITEF